METSERGIKMNAENVYRVIKISERVPLMGNQFHIEVSVKGIEYPSIVSLYADRFDMVSLEDKRDGRIQHALHVWIGGSMLMFVADMVIYPDGLFVLDNVEVDDKNARICNYKMNNKE